MYNTLAESFLLYCPIQSMETMDNFLDLAVIDIVEQSDNEMILTFSDNSCMYVSCGRLSLSKPWGSIG